MLGWMDGWERIREDACKSLHLKEEDNATSGRRRRRKMRMVGPNVKDSLSLSLPHGLTLSSQQS